MNQDQLTILNSLKEKPRTISVAEISNLEDRTLLYGYTCARDTFHVYLKNNELHKVIYSHQKEILLHHQGTTLDLDGIVPDKRLYPEACDFEFCSLLVVKGVNLPFTLVDANRVVKQFYGQVVTNKNIIAEIN